MGMFENWIIENKPEDYFEALGMYNQVPKDMTPQELEQYIKLKKMQYGHDDIMKVLRPHTYPPKPNERDVNVAWQKGDLGGYKGMLR